MSVRFIWAPIRLQISDDGGIQVIHVVQLYELQFFKSFFKV